MSCSSRAATSRWRAGQRAHPARLEEKPGLSCSQIGELALAGAQPAQLDEMLGVEEQLVHLGHLVDGQPARAAQQIVQVLERVFGAEPDMVKPSTLRLSASMTHFWNPVSSGRVNA